MAEASDTTTTPTQTANGNETPAAGARETHHEVHYVVLAANNFITTVILLCTSAFGLVAALAWNKFITDWLGTVTILNNANQQAKEFAYALAITLIAVMVISILGLINARVKGKNLLASETKK